MINFESAKNLQYISLEGWLSGRKRQSWKLLYLTVPGVRIPNLPPSPRNRAFFMVSDSHPKGSVLSDPDRNYKLLPACHSLCSFSKNLPLATFLYESPPNLPPSPRNRAFFSDIKNSTPFKVYCLNHFA